MSRLLKCSDKIYIVNYFKGINLSFVSFFKLGLLYIFSISVLYFFDVSAILLFMPIHNISFFSYLRPILYTYSNSIYTTVCFSIIKVITVRVILIRIKITKNIRNIQKYVPPYAPSQSCVLQYGIFPSLKYFSIYVWFGPALLLYGAQHIPFSAFIFPVFC